MRIIRRSRLLITRWLRKLRSKFFIQSHVFLKRDLPELWVLLSIKVQAQIKSIFHFLYKVFAKHQIILTDWQLEIFCKYTILLGVLSYSSVPPVLADPRDFLFTLSWVKSLLQLAPWILVRVPITAKLNACIN